MPSLECIRLARGAISPPRMFSCDEKGENTATTSGRLCLLREPWRHCLLRNSEFSGPILNFPWLVHIDP